MDSENANKSKRKKTSNIIQICIGVLAVVLAALIIVMMGIVSSIQGTARVVNYAGLVRGKTQRIIKLEISGQPEDGMIQDIEAFDYDFHFTGRKVRVYRFFRTVADHTFDLQDKFTADRFRLMEILVIMGRVNNDLDQTGPVT